jgi:hypothetical protein
MKKLLNILLFVIQVPLVSHTVNKTSRLVPNYPSAVIPKVVHAKAAAIVKRVKPELTSESIIDNYLGPRSRVVTGDTKLNETVSCETTKPELQLPINKQNLTTGESVAAAFALIKFPPPFEQATIYIPVTMTLLLTSPNAYLGKMSPLCGKARWLQGDGLSRSESVIAPNGYALLYWPARELGVPTNAKLILQMDSPVIAVKYLWSDFTCYGSDITKFLLHQITNWHYSSRYLNINRSGYREILFPTNIKDGVNHRQVGPILEPYLKQAVPQILRQLKNE